MILSVLLLFAFISASNSYAEALQDAQQSIRVRVFTLRNITAQKAKDYLQSAEIGDTILAIPGTNAISVTANSEELVYATNVIKLVDAGEKFDVRFLDIPQGKEVPENAQIEIELGRGYSIGTLMDGPGSEAVKAIVSAHKGKLLVIAPAEQSNKIIETIQKTFVEKAKVQDVNIAEPRHSDGGANQIAEPNEAEKKAEEEDMLNGFINELSKPTNYEKAKAQRQAALEKAMAEESAKIEAEKLRAQQEKEKIEEQINARKQQADRLRRKFTGESQPADLVLEEQQNLPAEVNEETIEVLDETKIVPEIDIPNGDEMLELNLPEELNLVNLIDLVGKYLNLNYLYDKTKVTGSVTLKVQGKLRIRELYNLLESVLKFRGFAMSRRGRLVTIVPTGEILDQDPTFAEHVKAGDVITTSVFHLKYITTATAKNLLGQMKLGSNITEVPEIGTLVITEYAFRMQRIEDLLSLVDVPGPPKEFKLRVLKYTIAEVLVPKIQTLAEQLGTVDITVGTATAQPKPQPRRRGRRQPQPAQPQTDTSKKTGVFLDFDKRTNRVLMIGLADEIDAVEQIIDTLDVPQQDVRVIQEYEIQYVDIEKIVQALGELGIIEASGGTGATIKPQAAAKQPPGAAPAVVQQSQDGGLVSLDQPQVVKLESTNSLLINATPEQHIQITRIISYIDREPVEAAIPYKIYRLENQEPDALSEVLNNLIQKTVQDKEGKIQQTIKYTEENIAIVPDKNTFSLIVYASKKNQEWIGNLIKTLDKRRPQVLIDVSLVEITRDDQFQFDLDVVGNAKGMLQNSLVYTPKAISTTFPTTSPRRTLLEGGFTSSGHTKGFYNTGQLQALLDMIDTKEYGRVLAKPKILVNDNEEGLIQTTDRVYAGKETSIYPTTTGGETPVPVTTVEWVPYEAKIELKITPQISEGDLLRLEIMMTREDFSSDLPTTENDPPPNYTTSNVNTIVTVPDGSTIILGGLTKLNQTKSANKVPLLGDIPVAGALFRSVSQKDTEGKKLYIFVKANILRPEAAEGLKQLEDISRTNKMEFEKEETKLQRYELFPGVKPTPFEPLKVLEQEVVEPNEQELTMKMEKQ